jgi:peptidoglycan/xylan/chitin deacetylase (PgdA/CDA1 family)
MIPFKTQLLKTALDALTPGRTVYSSRSGAGGVIFMLHHVRPATHPGAFSPNRILEVTPEFLEQTIQQILAAGHQIVTLDEAVRRLVRGEFARKFVCFTLDDGYLDNYLNAYPIFKRYNAPFTIYVNTALPDGSAVLWWWLLEEIVRDNAAIEVAPGDRDERFRPARCRKSMRPSTPA